MVVDTEWESLEAHQKAIASRPVAVVDRLKAVLAEPIQMHHVILTPKSSLILGDVPVVEVVTAFGIESKEAHSSKSRTVVDVLTASKEVLGATYGPIVEKIAKDDDEYLGDACMLFIGWSSKEAHMKFLQTQAAQDIIQMMNEGSTGGEMVSATPDNTLAVLVRVVLSVPNCGD